MEDFIKIIEPLNERNSRSAWGGGDVKRIIVNGGTFESIISLENLFTAWREFRRGKRSKQDVQLFEFTLEDNLFALHEDLVSGRYQHGSYTQFHITDPKQRLISKASVRDRVLHHAIYRILYPLFDQTFVFDSYSCRKDKGTHRAFKRLVTVSRKISKNYKKPCWALKCDVRKFFNSIDHKLLSQLLKERILDEKLLELLDSIIGSFCTAPGKGMPIGNLVSQLFVNVYLDPLDKFVQHRLRPDYFIRYADDIVILGSNPDELLGFFVEMNQFLKTKLNLSIHPSKVHLRKLTWGIDFVGYIALPHYSLPRRKTVKRIFEKVEKALKQDGKGLEESLPSYLGYLSHVNAYGHTRELRKLLLSLPQPAQHSKHN
jgi:retron-type reverse transcriptase